MSKADFNFYNLPGVEGDFVQPKLGNDIYHGAFLPTTDVLSGSRLPDVLAETVPFDYTQTIVEGNIGSNWSYLLDKMSPEKIRYLRDTRVDVQVPTDVIEATGYSPLEEACNLSRAIAQPQCLLPEDATAERLGMSEEKFGKLKRLLTPSQKVVEESVYVVGDRDQPQNPQVRYMNWMNLTAYRWQQGPFRQSEQHRGIGYDPTYNPRPTELIVAQSVTVTFHNPLINAQAK